MFGFAKHEKLAKAIESFMTGWLTVQAIDATLETPWQQSQVPEPPFHMAMFGILWGVADSTAQLQGLDMETTAKGLKLYLERIADERLSFVLIVAASRTPDLLPWVNLSGRAVRSIASGQDPMQVLLPLAEKYRLGKA